MWFPFKECGEKVNEQKNVLILWLLHSNYEHGQCTGAGTAPFLCDRVNCLGGKSHVANWWIVKLNNRTQDNLKGRWS